MFNLFILVRGETNKQQSLIGLTHVVDNTLIHTGHLSSIFLYIEPNTVMHTCHTQVACA